MKTSYCLWHKQSNRVAVNLAGRPLEGFTLADARFMISLINEQIRDQVEIRPMASLTN